MSVIKFKFFEALSAVTPVYGAVLAVNDKITDVFAKLQGLLTWRNTQVVVDPTIIGGINTTADYDFITLNIPANTLKVGDIIEFDIFDLIKKGSFNMDILHYIKVNTTKSANATTALGIIAVDSFGFRFAGSLQVRSIISDTVTFTYSTHSVGNDTNVVTGSNVVPTLTAPSTSNIAITVGANFSVANAANSIRPVAGGIKLW